MQNLGKQNTIILYPSQAHIGACEGRGEFIRWQPGRGGVMVSRNCISRADDIPYGFQYAALLSQECASPRGPWAVIRRKLRRQPYFYRHPLCKVGSLVALVQTAHGHAHSPALT
jgi:hypothetical protein